MLVMMLKHPSPLLFATMLLTVPFPCFFVFCYGVLPVSGLGLTLLSFATTASRDPVALIFVVPALFYIVVYGAFLRWFAGFLSRRVVSRPALAGRYPRQLLIAALIVLAVLPVYAFDCMDGRSLQWCNWYDLHVRSGGQRDVCGDFLR
jgi:hypothetical protein